MNNKIYASIVAMLSFMAVAFVSCDRDNSVESNVLDAIPENSTFIISTNDIDSVSSLINRDNPLTTMFYSPKSELKSMLCQVVDSLNDAGMFIDYLQPKAVVAIRKDGNCGLCQLYVRKTNLIGKDMISAAIDTLGKFGTIESRLFEENTIIKLKNSTLNSALSICFINDLVLISSSSKYLENAIQCIVGKANKITDNNDFMSAYSTAGKKELANVLFDTRAVADIFASELFEDNRIVKTYRSFDCWAGFDIVSGNPLLLNGFEFPKSDSAAFTAFVKSQPAIEFEVLSVIPEKASAYVLMSFGNAKTYDESLNNYLSLSENLKAREKLIADMNEAFGFDAKNKFYSIVKNEFAYVAAMNCDDAEKGAFVICGLLSQSAAELELKEMVPESMQTTLGEGSSTKVFKMPYDDIPAALFGDFFANCRGNYVCCVNNFLVFGNSIADLNYLVREIGLKNTMKSSISHADFLSKFSTSSSIFAYFSFNSGSEMMKRMFSRQYAGDIEAKKFELGKIGSCGIQLKRLDDMVYCNMAFIESEQSNAMGNERDWESTIGTSLATKPFVVKNHDTEEKEIIVQGKNGDLYLLNAISGEEIWHINIADQITSPIVQVDAYNNGKLQYLFSTKKEIFIVDRIGNFIKKIQLRADATSPVAVFDYESNRNYRLAIACDDKKVYVYDINGSLLGGWNFKGSENLVNSDILHYVISSEDFIVFHDQYKAYFLARNGSSKLEFHTNFKFSQNNIYCDIASSPKFVTTDENGVIRRFFKNKSQDSIVLEKFSTNHHFAMKDIDADGKLDYVFTDSSRLVVYGSDKKMMFEYDFGSEVSAPSFYYFGGQTRIGVNTSNGKLYLVNTNGTISDGFPLDGETPFSISEVNGSLHLFAGLKHGLLCSYKIMN